MKAAVTGLSLNEVRSCVLRCKVFANEPAVLNISRLAIVILHFKYYDLYIYKPVSCMNIYK